jgi:hypothetical protein
MTETAMRYNEGKPQLSYVMSARYALEGAAKVLEMGGLKYERDNWKKSFPKEALIDSMSRHITKFMDGEELDEESGLPHVDHILCNAIFLSYHFNGRKPKEDKGHFTSEGIWVEENE